jgi:hypothetical protein
MSMSMYLLESFVWQDWIDIVHSLDPSKPKGYPDQPRQIPKLQFNTGKAKRILGLQQGRFTKEETAKDILKYFDERGW